MPTAIVAGGRARRMGGAPKLLLPLGQGTVLDAILARLPPEAAPLALSANDPEAAPLLAALRARRPGAALLPDPSLPGVEERPGPLAGLLAAMEWAAALGAPAVLTLPGDAPFLPPDLLARLGAAGAPAVAASGGRLHPVAGLWPSAAARPLRGALAAGARRADALAGLLGATPVAFPAPPGAPDPFLNVNRPEDLAEARRWS